MLYSSVTTEHLRRICNTPTPTPVGRLLWQEGEQWVTGCLHTGGIKHGEDMYVAFWCTGQDAEEEIFLHKVSVFMRQGLGQRPEASHVHQKASETLCISKKFRQVAVT